MIILLEAPLEAWLIAVKVMPTPDTQPRLSQTASQFKRIASKWISVIGVGAVGNFQEDVRKSGRLSAGDHRLRVALFTGHDAADPNPFAKEWGGVYTSSHAREFSIVTVNAKIGWFNYTVTR